MPLTPEQELARELSAEDSRVETEARELARAIWSVVLLARDPHKARGLLGKVERRNLVERIVSLMRVVRGRK